jgi:ligand-binding sensor domain-containing protein
MATPDGGLWISFRPSGLRFWKDGRLTVWSRREDLPAQPIYAFARDFAGRIWAGTQDGLLLRDGSRWITVAGEWNFRPERIRNLFTDSVGTIWVATETTVVFLRPGSKAFETTGARVASVRSR